MTEKYGRGKNPNSLANLKKRTSFNSEDGRATAAAKKLGAMRRDRAAAKDVVWGWILDRIELYNTPRSKSEILERSKNDQLPHHQRVDALRSMNPKMAKEDIQDIEERVLGKPTQVIDNNLSGDLNVSKPSIVFNDVEGASRKGEEERLQSEEEDI